MIGDSQDIVLRLKHVLPLRWFPDDTPVLDSLLNGLGWAWAFLYDSVQYVRLQTRLSTAEGIWLDIAAKDYFGDRVKRRSGQGDELFRRKLQRDLVRERGTRSAILSILLDLTGQLPGIFEPANPSDTGGYGGTVQIGGGIAYGVAGGWGSLNLPFQCFITAYRPTGAGIASVAGWAGFAGGYGVGSIEYASLSMISGRVTDSDIYAAIADVLPVGAIGWARIASP